MATIAKMAGVSQGAISSLLNDRDYGIRVSEKTRERVFKVCRDLGYVPNDLRAVVRMYPDLGDVCLLVPAGVPGGVMNPFISRIAAGILAALPKPGDNLVIAQFDENREYGGEEELPPAVKNGTASKFICAGTPNASICRIIQRRNHPVIVIGHESHVPGTTSIVPDYVEAARQAFAHFVKNGHRSAAIIGGPFGSPEPRLAEMNRAIGIAAAEFGLAIDTQNIVQGDLSFEAGVAACDALGSRSSAVFSLSEAASSGLVARALAKGTAVPEKLSVVALADHAGPTSSVLPLSTVSTGVAEIAVGAIAEASRQISEGLPLSPQKTIAVVTFQARQSSGPLKK